MEHDVSEFYTAHQYLENLLKRHLLSQKEAAARLGISSGYLCDVLKGRRRVTPELAILAIERIETEQKDVALAELHWLGALQDGWRVSRRPLSPEGTADAE